MDAEAAPGGRRIQMYSVFTGKEIPIEQNSAAHTEFTKLAALKKIVYWGNGCVADAERLEVKNQALTYSMWWTNLTRIQQNAIKMKLSFEFQSWGDKIIK